MFVTAFDRIWTVSVGDDKKVKAEFHSNSGKTSCLYDLQVTCYTQESSHHVHAQRHQGIMGGGRVRC